MPVGRQFASGSSFDCRASIIFFAAGRSGIVSPLPSPTARSPTGPPPLQTPDKSGFPSGRRGVGPCGGGGSLDGLWTRVGSAGGVWASNGTSRRATTQSPVPVRARCFLTLRLLELLVSAGRSGKYFAAVWQHHFSRVGHLRTVLGQRTVHGDAIADLEGRPLPAIPDQNVRAGELQVPIRHLALLILDVDVEPRVRIQPFDTCHHAFQLDRLVGVVLRRERMMRENRPGPDEKTGACQHNNQPGLHRYLPSASGTHGPPCHSASVLRDTIHPSRMP